MDQALTLVAGGAMEETHRERLAALFDRQRAPLFRFALRIARDRDEALDLLQEAFLRAATAKRIPDDDGEARSWMFRTIVNLARDRYRREKVRELFAKWFRREPERDAADAVISRNAVQRALVTLPPRQRAIVALHELEHHSVAEVAAELRVAPATVRWHLAEARKRLAEILRPLGDRS